METGIDARAVVRNLATAVRDHYVFPQKGASCEQHLLASLERGTFARVDAAALARRLEHDLREWTKDLHFRVRFRAEEDGASEVHEEPWRNPARNYNHGFRRVEHLPGNVGYLELSGFHDPAIAGETARAAMAFLQHSDALIIDLRRNGGGSAEMVKLMASWVLPPKTPLSGIYWRQVGEIQQAWTEAWLEHRLTTVPMFVLTSNYTFSAAEALAYDLQVAGRAMIVGETTGGGAHPGDEMDLGQGLHVWMPMGRAVHPATGSNWEGSGVVPDHEISARFALHAAHALALDSILEHATAPTWRRELEWYAEGARSLGDMDASGSQDLTRLPGRYAGASVQRLGDALFFTQGDGRVGRMSVMRDGRYAVDALPECRIRFCEDERGAITDLSVVNRDGIDVRYPRDND